MRVPPILERHPALRWLVPIGIACLAGAAATGLLKSGPSAESLPRTTPAALIAAVQDNRVTGFSGTVVSHLSLGLPELPSVAGAGDDASFGALLSGSHTMQVWYGAADKQRVALLGATDETDIFRNGPDVWQWSSADGVAVHTVLPPRPADALHGIAPSAPTSLTPVDLARRALGAMGNGTRVSVDENRTVADRSTYDLVLTPRSTATKVGSVHISIDGATKVPLGVQVYPRGSSSAAVDVAFTSISFGHQSERNFEFSPPPSARVRTVHVSPDAAHRTLARSVRQTGSGWTTVVRLAPGRAAIARYAKGDLLRQLTPVAGSWGRGRLLDAPLVSVLVTRDGRLYAGAVEPADLYAAAASK